MIRSRSRLSLFFPFFFLISLGSLSALLSLWVDLFMLFFVVCFLFSSLLWFGWLMVYNLLVNVGGAFNSCLSEEEEGEEEE